MNPNQDHVGSSILTAESRSEAAHTPGPWHWTCDGDDQPGRVGVTLPCEPVEHCGYDSHCIALTQPGKFDQRANARLIAAAPDLLRELERCAVHIAAMRGDSDEYAVAAFAAISRATSA